MPVLMGLDPAAARRLLGGLPVLPHPAGVWFSLPPDGVGPLWARCYAHWRLGFANPPRALVNILAARGLTLAVAESCTGGATASAITDVPGASRVFSGGVVAYTPAVKAQLLGCSSASLPTGGVDAALTGRLAQAVAAALDASLGLALTGVLGPASPRPDLPVGRVYISLSRGQNTETHRFNFSGDRHTIKTLAAEAAVNLILAALARW